MLNTTVDLIVHELRRYGEDAVAEWAAQCSDDELMRVCSVADWLLLRGPELPSGASMRVGKACALAAVYVCEDRPRELKRRHRLPLPAPPAALPGHGRAPDPMAQLNAPRDYGIGQDARDFWTPPPGRSVRRRQP